MSGIPTPPHQKPTVSEGKTPGPDERGAPRNMSPVEREAFISARKRRNRAIALGLIGFAVLVFVITALRLMQNIAAGQAG
ncbi:MULTISPECIES: hypothetical protein [Hyphobacterium]|uniref:Protoheme IX farnesyltransferase n=1 Tax=Hyphobacterium vulgare TaxID=1736751 RepID=A0ABV6ZYU6_9PROT